MKNVLLFKITKDEYLDDILDGNLFMNTYNFYRKTEEKINRGDKQEGVASSYLADSVKISITNSEGKLVPIGGLINRINFMYPFDHQVNIFCMTLFELNFLEVTNFNFKLDKRFCGFGDKAILITQPQEFIDRITKSVNGKKSPPCSNKFFDKVDYLANEYSGRIGCFSKLEEYAWQNEWRLAILDPARIESEPIVLKIGNIESICRVFETESLARHSVKVSLNETSQ
ncbi:hypothetical protein DGG96_17025 [Legionella qingyii]|uniref:Uncharacterized protein n=1 Tax=Legionella qingyii TaxID=2184757 RepID=A0A317TYA6_9GAMM|nr:hypothetical protein [Legionella qingyii]PWY54111.1 hypothetical protein DGG96_18565 [Legionella qingyii]PWY54471.1 hypothetical protein DGG96_17025 [Legionella qingyii]RUR21113.1 hypothetical protein ELY20_13450 [Legionella qingyii]